MSKKRIASIICIFLLLSVVALGCAQSNSSVGTEGASGVAGFWPGLWQGLILPIAFVISLFDDSVGIYEIHNNGNWYNFGFVLGTWFIFSCILASKQGRK